jgi:hypothetical protein
VPGESHNRSKSRLWNDWLYEKKGTNKKIIKLKEYSGQKSWHFIYV